MINIGKVKMRAATEPWPGVAYKERNLRSFDGGTVCSCKVHRPDRYAPFEKQSPAVDPLIARGSGLSYTAASFLCGGRSIDMRLFDRILAFDPNTGEVEVEAGLTIGALCEFLMAHGRYLAVQPGHGQITVGGCIAANVHGKNPARDGTFSSQVVSIRLYHPAVGLNEISENHEPAVFEATCGGYGLTGVIVSARLATKRLSGNTLLVQRIIVSDPGEGAAVMKKMSATADLVYSWHDFSTPAGRGIVFTGSFSTSSESQPMSPRPCFLSADWRARYRLKWHGRLTGRVVNTAFYLINARNKSSRPISVYNGLFPVHGKESYFLGFGSKGFHEHQAILPDDAFSDYVSQARRLARKRGDIPFILASGKYFAGGSRLLQFAGSGTCLALNVPRGAGTERLLDDLNGLLVEMKGKPNIIKDSTLRAQTVAACYPEYERFRDIVRQWDPKRLFKSELSQRLNL